MMRPCLVWKKRKNDIKSETLDYFCRVGDEIVMFLYLRLKVIARIFYNVNRSWSGQITLAELRHSNLLATIQLLEEEDDINQITDYFSYEHFYVIYCKFWELDKDHDLFIDKKDLARHNDHGLKTYLFPFLVVS